MANGILGFFMLKIQINFHGGEDVVQIKSGVAADNGQDKV
jgi:hypothetical protein